MTESFRTFDLSELDDRELHAYRMGLCSLLLHLETENRRLLHALDAVVMADALGVEKFRTIEGGIDSLQPTLRVGREENIAVLTETEKRQEEKNDG